MYYRTEKFMAANQKIRFLVENETELLFFFNMYYM